MKKRMMLGAAALAAVGLIAAFATAAYAKPTKTTTYSESQSGATLVVTANQTASDGTTAIDTTAPVTTSDAVATYAGSTTIHLTATDNVGGSGVATTYYILDGETQVSGTSVPVSAVGSHTLLFWSVDVAGNIESQVQVSFEITAPAAEATGTAIARIHVMAKNGRGIAGATVTLTNKTTGSAVTLVTDRRGRVTFTKLPVGIYTASVTMSDGYVLTKTFKVTAHRHATITLKDHRRKTHVTHAAPTAAHASVKAVHGSSKRH